MFFRFSTLGLKDRLISKNRGGNMRKIALASAAFVFCLASCASLADSPTAIFKGFIAAAKKRDASAMKKYLSRDSLNIVKSAAGAASKTEEEFLTSMAEA